MFVSFLVIALLISIDQYSKFLVETSYQQPFELIPGYIEIHYSRNTGIAFSLFDSHPLVLTIINSLIMLGFVTYFARNHQKLLIENLPAILIIAGGLANLIDRFCKGFVVDFINPIFIDFAIFNFADCFLNIGVFLLILEMLFNAKRRA